MSQKENSVLYLKSKVLSDGVASISAYGLVDKSLGFNDLILPSHFPRGVSCRILSWFSPSQILT